MKKMTILCLALILALSVFPAALGEEEFTFRSDGRLEGYSGPGGAVTIPAEHGGEPVRALYRKALSGNGSVAELIFESGIQALGEAACYGMTALEKVTLPDTLAAIGEANFTNCQKLREITLPASLMLVGPNCFSWCTDMKTVTFLGAAPVSASSASAAMRGT